MKTAILVPTLGESIVEATVGKWHKREGDSIKIGDVLVSLQTDKVDLDVEAQVAGVLQTISKPETSDVSVGDQLGEIAGEGAIVAPSAPTPQPQVKTPASVPVVAAPVAIAATNGGATPVAKRMADAQGVDLSQLSGSGRDGKVTKADVVAAKESSAVVATPAPLPATVTPVQAVSPVLSADLAALFGTQAPREERVKMSRRRRTIAKRLVEAQHTAAMLTTFNEVDMSAVNELRNRRKQWFEEKYGVRLGYTSFFTKASVAALQAFPRLNAEIDGEEMVIKRYYDIGIAVGAEEGLVVPVLRSADKMSFADIEKKVREFGKASKENTLGIEDLAGGTFTITNGGVFGSMLSTPILNKPQVGILGLHNIVDRAVVRNGEIVIRPIMYLALSYDHRIVDGREAVQFLYRIKELIEDPEDLLLAG